MCTRVHAASGHGQVSAVAPQRLCEQRPQAAHIARVTASTRDANAAHNPTPTHRNPN